MSKGLLIVGAGGHGKVIADCANQAGDWSRLAFLDEDGDLPDELMEWPVFRSIDDSRSLLYDFPDAAIAIGNCALRSRLIAEFHQLGFRLPVIQHPSAVVSRYTEIGAGSQIMPMSVINAGTRAGPGCIINTAATVDHDCVLGDSVHLSPGAHLAGGVAVDDRSWIGIGACVRENCRIGQNVTVGAGAVVVADIDDGLTVIGVPARPLQRVRG